MKAEAGMREQKRGGADERKYAVYRAALGVSVAALVACFVIGSLLAINYIQLRRSDPLNNPELVQLRERFAANPGDPALKESIRVLQLLSRKVFFTGQAHLRRGGLLLLLFGGLLLVALNVAGAVRETLPDPSKFLPQEGVWPALAVRRKAVVWAGALLVVAGLGAGVLSHSELEKARIRTRAVAPVPVPPQPAKAGDAPAQPAPKKTGEEALLANWPNFRGPRGDGIAHVKQAPAGWDGKAGAKIVWKAGVPRAGLGSPVVWQDRVYVTGGDETGRTVYCLDADSGNVVWARDVGDVPGASEELPQISDDTGWAASSPATDGERVFAIFATGNLVCFDRAGKLVWAEAMGIPENHYGHSSSLFVYDNTLFVQFDDGSDPRVVAKDPATGEDRWSAERWALSWASPLCARVGERVQLILVDSEAVAGYDAGNGELLWQEKCMEGEVAASPAYAGGMVFVANDMAVGAGIALEDAGGLVKATVKWRYDDSLPDVASPLAAKGYVVLALSAGALVCLDAASGELKWEAETDTGFYASPLLVAGDVYALDQDGVMHVFEPGDTYVEKAAYPLGEAVSSTPAVMAGRMYIRAAEHLYCVGK